MSKIVVEQSGDELMMQCSRARMKEKDTQITDIRTLKYNKKYTSYVKLRNKEDANRILFWQEMQITPLDELENKDAEAADDGSQEKEEHAEAEAAAEADVMEEVLEHKVLFVMTNDSKILYGYMNAVRIYKMMVSYVYKVAGISLRGKKLHVHLLSYLVNKYEDAQIENTRFYIDENNYCQAELKIYPEKISKKRTVQEGNRQHFELPLENLLTDETQINNMLNMMVTVNGMDLDFRIGKRKKNLKNIRKYYAPYRSCYLKDFAIHLRRTDRGNFAIVKRPMEPIESTLKFKVMESKPVSWFLYYAGKVMRKFGGRKVNLFYEKFAEKAEEGTFDLFCMARDRNTSACYYIIDENSPDYETIKSEKNIVKKYSLKYYWLLYRVNSYIATEAPAHLNILRSNNKYFRLSTCEHPFIFLQHGVTYLKCQGPTSTFVKGKEGEPRYMIVGSQKEQDAVCDMLNLPEEAVLNTGLPIFSKIVYGHIGPQSPDKVVIMLTWKSYEEHILEFENSEYYKNVMEVYHMLEQYIAPENIIIVPHPKMAELCENTSLSETMWKNPISEVLGLAKLLITDYSSVCYNSFYQGGGVIFYQPDLERYEKEAGSLIPAEDEYIGARVFDIEALEQAVSAAIKGGRIDLDVLRGEEYERRYQTINEYSDGKNIERIAERLIELEII